MGAGTVVLGWINRVVRGGERQEYVIAEFVEDNTCEGRRGKHLMKEYRKGRIKMLSADETRKAIDDLRRKWSSRWSCIRYRTGP